MAKSPTEKALTPEGFKTLKTKTPPTNTAGFAGIKAASSHAFKYIKPSNILKISKKLNQKGGFDCPCCAWPDPDDERSSLGEYCENGLKAMAEEMQNTLIDRDFFKKILLMLYRIYQILKLVNLDVYQNLCIYPKAQHITSLLHGPKLLKKLVRI